MADLSTPGSPKAERLGAVRQKAFEDPQQARIRRWQQHELERQEQAVAKARGESVEGTPQKQGFWDRLLEIQVEDPNRLRGIISTIGTRLMQGIVEPVQKLPETVQDIAAGEAPVEALDLASLMEVNPTIPAGTVAAAGYRNPFYSPLKESVSTGQAGKFPIGKQPKAGSLQKTLERGGVSRTELEYSGLLEELGKLGPQDRVPIERLQELIGGRTMDLEVGTLGGPVREMAQTLDNQISALHDQMTSIAHERTKYKDKLYGLYKKSGLDDERAMSAAEIQLEKFEAENGPIGGSAEQLYKEMGELMAKRDELGMADDVQYGNMLGFNLKNGDMKTYRERLFYFTPEVKFTDFRDAKQHGYFVDRIGENKNSMQGIQPDELLEVYNPDGQSIARVPSKDLDKWVQETYLPIDEAFKYKHFTDRASNLMMHSRGHVRTLVDGKKTLYLDEVQSDWIQAGYHQGWRKKEKVPENIEELIRKTNQIGWDKTADRRAAAVELLKSVSPGDAKHMLVAEATGDFKIMDGAARESLEAMAAGKTDDLVYGLSDTTAYVIDNLAPTAGVKLNPELYDAWKKADRVCTKAWEENDRLTQLNKTRGWTSGVMDTPFKENWNKVLLRDWIWQATQEGHTNISWPSAVIQNKRNRVYANEAAVGLNPDGSVDVYFNHNGETNIGRTRDGHKAYDSVDQFLATGQSNLVNAVKDAIKRGVLKRDSNTVELQGDFATTKFYEDIYNKDLIKEARAMGLKVKEGQTSVGGTGRFEIRKADQEYRAQTDAEVAEHQRNVEVHKRNAAFFTKMREPGTRFDYHITAADRAEFIRRYDVSVVESIGPDPSKPGNIRVDTEVIHKDAPTGTQVYMYELSVPEQHLGTIKTQTDLVDELIKNAGWNADIDTKISQNYADEALEAIAGPNDYVTYDHLFDQYTNIGFDTKFSGVWKDQQDAMRAVVEKGGELYKPQIEPVWEVDLTPKVIEDVKRRGVKISKSPLEELARSYA